MPALVAHRPPGRAGAAERDFHLRRPDGRFGVHGRQRDQSTDAVERNRSGAHGGPW